MIGEEISSTMVVVSAHIVDGSLAEIIRDARIAIDSDA